MNVTIKQLQAFVAVAKSGSFAEACTRLHLSQPALSIAIKNLEETVGGKLLERSTRSVALTPEGAMPADHCAGDHPQRRDYHP